MNIGRKAGIEQREDKIGMNEKIQLTEELKTKLKDCKTGGEYHPDLTKCLFFEKGYYGKIAGVMSGWKNLSAVSCFSSSVIGVCISS